MYVVPGLARDCEVKHHDKAKERLDAEVSEMRPRD